MRHIFSPDNFLRCQGVPAWIPEKAQFDWHTDDRSASHLKDPAGALACFKRYATDANDGRKDLVLSDTTRVTVFAHSIGFLTTRDIGRAINMGNTAGANLHAEKDVITLFLGLVAYGESRKGILPERWTI